MLDVLLDIEITLVRLFGWTIRDIDETDVEHLLMFMARYAEVSGAQVAGDQAADSQGLPMVPPRSRYAGKAPATRPARKRAYCDQVSWL